MSQFICTSNRVRSRNDYIWAEFVMRVSVAVRLVWMRLVRDRTHDSRVLNIETDGYGTEALYIADVSHTRISGS